MLKTLEPYKCITITMDPVYSEIFETQWFEKFSTAVSYIMIHVEENEDLLSPSDETRRSLMLAKKDSCQLYIILIANGIEAARLLRFGERYIASRGKSLVQGATFQLLTEYCICQLVAKSSFSNTDHKNLSLKLNSQLLFYTACYFLCYTPLMRP
nr:unnamed protein product [Callosobruchus analis]